MTARYEIWFTDDTGKRLAQLSKRALIDDATWFAATKTVNDLGAMAMGLPWSFDRNLLKRDNMIQIWREPIGGRLSLLQAYFINRFRVAIERGEKTVTVWGAGGNVILWWRRVAYFNKETDADIEAIEADNAMKDIVDTNLVTVTAFEAGADTTARQWPAVSVQADLTNGPAVTKRAAWKNVLQACQELAAASKEEGTEVWFEMFPVLGSDSISFNFRTFTGQPGQDLTGLGVVFAADKGTLSSVSLEYDYTNEYTYVYSLGQGQDSNRNVQVASDSDRIGASAWGRKEFAVNSTIEEDDAGTSDVAESALFAGRPLIRFVATPVDTEQFRFGRDWNFGDKVTARFENREFDCIIRTVQIAMRNQEETVTARLGFES